MLLQVRGQHYDLVLNGVEIGGGSVRVHDADMQEYVFAKILQVCPSPAPAPALRLQDRSNTALLQLSEKEKAAFGHLLHALRCGAPPHGGIALGASHSLCPPRRASEALNRARYQVSTASWRCSARPSPFAT